MRIAVESLPQMRTVAEVLAGHLGAGDLLILSGNLGAGKTTFTQSLGRALGVAGRITSPTFVIAREHPSTQGGPTLVHVDAYRLSDAEELGDLDLDSELEESITVVEWGAGLAEQLSADHLDMTITPIVDEPPDAVRSPGAAGAAGSVGEADPFGAATDPDDELLDERRSLDFTARGDSWTLRLPAIIQSLRAAGIDVTPTSVSPDPEGHA